MTENACTKIKHFNECSTLKSSIIQPFTSVPVVRTAVMLGKRAENSMLQSRRQNEHVPQKQILIHTEVEEKREKMIGKKWLFFK